MVLFVFLIFAPRKGNLNISPAGRYDQFTAFGCCKKSSDIADKEKALGFQVFNASSTFRRVVNAFYKQRREILFTKKAENVKMFTKAYVLVLFWHIC